MKIAIVNNYVPFIYGGAEFLADSLNAKLKEYGHSSIIVKLPFKWNPPEKVLESVLASRLMYLANVDLVIPLKFPAYCISHPNKVLWLLHQFRQAYDLWGTPFQDIPNSDQGKAIREAIITIDNQHLSQAKKIYTNSHVTSERLYKFNQLDSEILYPPLMDDHIYFCQEYGDFIFYPSRISEGKRQYLIVESFRYTQTPVKLVIAGNPDNPNDLIRLQSLIETHQLQDKVKLIGNFISQKEKANLFAHCLGCTYIPYDEDSYGYVTLEAYHAFKPVISCTDSGGTSIVVKDQENGFLVSPHPQEIAQKIDLLYNQKNLAETLGRNGYEHLKKLNITWDHVIRSLTQ